MSLLRGVKGFFSAALDPSNDHYPDAVLIADLRKETARLRLMVERRDDFLTVKGLWPEFQEASRNANQSR